MKQNKKFFSTISNIAKNKPHLIKVRDNIKPFRDNLLKHEIYNSMNNLKQTQVFMSNHVFAVWDFMSLLKSLQKIFTCVSTPWIPRQDPSLSYFINEIVFNEESDDLGTGDPNQAISHYLLYMKGMEEIKSDYSAVTYLVNQQIDGIDWRTALENTENKYKNKDSLVSPVVFKFVEQTLKICEKNKPHIITSYFLFGREDPIPRMFQNILNNLTENKIDCKNLKTYLARHIEVDGGRHTELAENTILAICGNDESLWREVEVSAIEAIEWRRKLWDGVLQKIKHKM